MLSGRPWGIFGTLAKFIYSRWDPPRCFETDISMPVNQFPVTFGAETNDPVL